MNTTSGGREWVGSVPDRERDRAERQTPGGGLRAGDGGELGLQGQQRAADEAARETGAFSVT